VRYEFGEVTEFLNVDLDVVGGEDLTPLVQAMGARILSLYCGKLKRGYVARMELARQPKTADEAIRKLTALIARLPTSSRRLWNGARIRDFNVGVQSGQKPWCSEFPIRPETLRLAAQLEARVVMTVYGRPEGIVGAGAGAKTKRRPTTG
jgi:hypothetical protein